MVKELRHTTNQTHQYYLQGVVRMIQLKMMVHVLSYRIEIKINLTRKKAQLYVGYTKGQHINGWSITLSQDLFNNSKSSMQ